MFFLINSISKTVSVWKRVTFEFLETYAAETNNYNNQMLTFVFIESTHVSMIPRKSGFSGEIEKTRQTHECNDKTVNGHLASFAFSSSVTSHSYRFLSLFPYLPFWKSN